MTVLKWILAAMLVSAAAIVVQSLPDIARYMKMRSM